MKNKFTKTLSVVLTMVIIAVMFMTGCSSGNSSGSANSSSSAASESSGDTITVTDNAGRTVEVPTDVENAVSVMGACTVPSLLSALGVDEKLTSGICFDYDLQYKIAPEYEGLDVIRANDDGVLNVEDLTAKDPDVVFVWDTISNLDQLEATGIPIIVTSYDSWDGIFDWVDCVAATMNVPDRGDEIDAYLKQLAEKVSGWVADIPEEDRVSAIVTTSADPITVCGVDNMNNDVLKMSGGVSVAEEAGYEEYWTEPTNESFMAADPDVIIVSGVADEAYTAYTTDSTFSELSAVKNGKVYEAPKGTFAIDKPGLEIGLFLVWQAYIFYPDVVTQDMLISETKDFYSNVYNYDITDDEINEMYGF
jgi:iron complex transport system substrate-binding protein